MLDALVSGEEGKKQYGNDLVIERMKDQMGSAGFSPGSSVGGIGGALAAAAESLEGFSAAALS